MNKTLIADKDFHIHNNLDTSQLRRIVVSRFAANLTGSISPIERWSDHNYAPRKLEIVWNVKSESYEIIALLHRFKAGDVHVDISRGNVIILLSRSNRAASSKDEEYYCEVPIPADARQQEVVVEISTYFLTVRLQKKQNVFQRAASTARRLKQDFALLRGRGWTLGRLDS